MSRFEAFEIVRHGALSSVFSAILGSELFAAALVIEMLGAGSPPVGALLGLLILAPLYATLFVVPLGTASALLLSPIAYRMAPTRNVTGLLGLFVLGAFVGFLVLFGISATFATLISDAVRVGLTYGATFGALTALMWWWLLPSVKATKGRAVA